MFKSSWPQILCKNWKLNFHSQLQENQQGYMPNCKLGYTIWNLNPHSQLQVNQQGDIKSHKLIMIFTSNEYPMIDNNILKFCGMHTSKYGKL
jgi:hypothetical protein